MSFTGYGVVLKKKFAGAPILFLRFTLFIFITCAGIELGLRLHGTQARWLDRPLSADATQSRPHKLLFFGDSVTGQGPFTYPSLLQLELNQGANTPPVQIINLAHPSARSGDVAASLEKELAIYNPDAAVVMIGLADPIQGQLLIAPPGLLNQDSWRLAQLVHVYFANLLLRAQFAYENFQVFLHDLGFLLLKSMSRRAVSRLFWNQYRQRLQGGAAECAATGIYYQENFLDDDPISRGLRDCFLLVKDIDGGIRHFQAWSERQPESRVLRAVLSHLYLERGDVAAAKSATAVDAKGDKYLLSQKIRQHLEDQETEYPVRQLEADLNDLTAAEEVPRHPHTLRALREIHDIARRKGKKLIFLQYPNSNSRPLANAFLSAEEPPVIFDSNQALRERAQREGVAFLSYFDEDFIHLSPAGHRALAGALAPQLRRLLEK